MRYLHIFWNDAEGGNTEHIKREVTPEEKERLNEIERKAQQDFPPAALQPSSTGIAAQIRRARKAQDLSWHDVAQMAKIADANVVRDIEYGLDAKLSSVEAVVTVLGLKLEAVDV